MAALAGQTEERVFNFSAGPCCLPYEVLQIAKEEMLNYKQSGMSVMEMSHRSKEYMKINDEANATLREIIQVPDNYKLLFMQGGASLQFACAPMNLLSSSSDSTAHVVTGQWSQKAFQECEKYCAAYKACDTKSSNYNRIPAESEWKVNESSRYLHYCANETVHGVEFKHTPKVSIPLVSDMSSNFCSKPIDVANHALIYAGAQKNVGPAGVRIVIVRDDLLGKEMKICPSVCSYKITADNHSLYNTPPCFAVYVVGLMAKYLKQKGGLAYWQECSEKKSRLIYDLIDSSNKYYTCHAEKCCRSNMNIPFRVGGGDEKLEAKFLEDAKKKKLYTLGGHRSVGGCRASLYNGMPWEGVDTLATFMKEFMEENPVA